MSTSKVLPVAFLGLAIGCGSAKNETPAPDDGLKFPGGDLAQKIGVERWVLHGTASHGEISGFDSPTPDQGKTVVHALFEVDPKGVATLDFDLPEAWHGAVSPDGSADTGGDPPASAVLALLSSLDDIPVAPPSQASTGLVAQAVGSQVRPLDYQSHLTDCLVRLLYPGATTYQEVQQQYNEKYGFCDKQTMADRFKDYKYLGTNMFETQAGKTCDSVQNKSMLCTIEATNKAMDEERGQPEQEPTSAIPPAPGG
jgi:hypothetical protein